MKAAQEMQNAFFHHFMFSPQSQAMVDGKSSRKPMEQASESSTEFTVLQPNFLEFLHVDIIAC